MTAAEIYSAMCAECKTLRASLIELSRHLAVTEKLLDQAQKSLESAVDMRMDVAALPIRLGMSEESATDAVAALGRPGAAPASIADTVAAAVRAKTAAEATP